MAHFCSMCGPKFCSMSLTQEVREYAKQQELADEEEALRVGMDHMSAKFADMGGSIYVPAGAHAEPVMRAPKQA